MPVARRCGVLISRIRIVFCSVAESPSLSHIISVSKSHSPANGQLTAGIGWDDIGLEKRESE